MVETRVHLHSNSPIPNLNLCNAVQFDLLAYQCREIVRIQSPRGGVVVWGKAAPLAFNQAREKKSCTGGGRPRADSMGEHSNVRTLASTRANKDGHG